MEKNPDVVRLMERLKDPFPPNLIHWRLGMTNKRKVQRENNDPKARPTKAIPLAYIDARDVMKRLDDVMGIDGWQCKYEYVGDKLAVCSIGLNIYGEWLWKSDGAGASEIESEKGMMSDSFKRAAVRWGIGRYLYYLPNEWVDIDRFGHFVPPKLPDWAMPGVFDEEKAEKEDAA